jgi:hypothetical protein
MSRPAPTPQAGQRLGDAIQGLVDNALSGAQREIQQKLDELRLERAALNDALNSTSVRPARLEIQSQINRLDREIGQLQQGLDKIGRNVTRDVQTPPPTQIFTETRSPGGGFGGGRGDNFDPTPVVATSLGILFIAFPLTLAIVRFIWKRSTSAPAPAVSAEQTRRFDRLEQSVDAIAIEIERISENQRYLTKVLSSSREHSQLP